jgi:hypothetical protein
MGNRYERYQFFQRVKYEVIMDIIERKHLVNKVPCSRVGEAC